MRPTEEILHEGIQAGQFGGESKPHGDHAMGFVAFLGEPETEFSGNVIDIGSGAGLPALVLADAYPNTAWTLIERRSGRTDLLARAIHRLEFSNRVAVLAEDAAVAARSDLRGTADWVTARSFGPPGDTAECAAPFLRTGGLLLVSEPFDSILQERWPEAGLERVGLEFVDDWETPAGRYVRFRRTGADISLLPRKGARKKLLF